MFEENAAPPTERKGRDATEDEIKNLKHVADSVPLNAWIALAISGAERFSFYAVTIPWQNYMQNSRDSVAVPGALGLGQATATSISSAFFFFSFVAPTPFAILSDVWLGRYRTLCLSVFLSFCGCLVIFATSLPAVDSQPTKLAGLVVAIIFLGLGTGGVKATISPFIGDQYPVKAPQIVVNQAGQQVVIDRTLTLQYIYNIFYWFTNIGALSMIASTYLERGIGFWAAYLLPLCSVSLLLPCLIFFQKSFVKRAPQGNVLPKAAKVILCSARHGFRLDAAEPSYQAEHHGRHVSWDEQFISEIRRGLNVCKVMACFVPFHLCMNQIVNNLVSQAGQMQLGGVPNDTIQVINPIACVLLGPLVQKLLYPSLRKICIRFGRISRIACAFVTMSMAMALAAGIQKLIYTRGPCYEHPLACPGSEGGKVPNEISVWVQTPLYFVVAFAEIMGFTTLFEYNYSAAPVNMRSLVQALSQLSSGVGSGLGMAVSPVSVNPKILWLYTGLSLVMVVTAPVFWLVFRSYDKIDRESEESER